MKGVEKVVDSFQKHFSLSLFHCIIAGNFNFYLCMYRTGCRKQGMKFRHLVYLNVNCLLGKNGLGWQSESVNSMYRPELKMLCEDRGTNG